MSNTDDQERVDQAVAAIDGKLLRPKFEDKEIFPLIKNLLKNEGFEDVVVTKMDPKPVYQYPIGDFSEIDEQGELPNSSLLILTLMYLLQMPESTGETQILLLPRVKQLLNV